MEVVWVVAVWLISLTLFVALRADVTRASRRRRMVGARSVSTATLPSQRQPMESREPVRENG